MACFADINVSQGSVATYARCGGIFDIHLTANLPVQKFVNRLRVDRIMVMSLWSRFLAHAVSWHAPGLQPYTCYNILVGRREINDQQMEIFSANENLLIYHAPSQNRSRDT